ncbi:MAG: hypothetical protein HYY06_11080 [Deltaproteobacteria bacterium]|nr:hypothetical protein [Deltaproteobacteria bacterium]
MDLDGDVDVDLDGPRLTAPRDRGGVGGSVLTGVAVVHVVVAVNVHAYV